MSEYEAQWRGAIARLAAGRPSSALVTSYAGSGDVIHSMRPMWRVGNTVFFQERLVRDRDIGPPKVADQFYEMVGERATLIAMMVHRYRSGPCRFRRCWRSSRPNRSPCSLPNVALQPTSARLSEGLRLSAYRDASASARVSRKLSRSLAAELER